jgi:hypothetical protein
MPLHIRYEVSSETYVFMILERTWLLSIGFAVDVFLQGSLLLNKIIFSDSIQIMANISF